MTKQNFDKCHLCGENIKPTDRIGKIDRYNFHYGCYLEALDRLENFWEILTLPEDQWKEWLEDDSQ